MMIPVQIGVYASGEPVTIDLASSSLGVSGASRSGKSTAVYGLLGRLPQGVRLWGADPTGILFNVWRPDPWRVLTTRNLPQVVEMLRGVVDELDKRLDYLLEHKLDKLPVNQGFPYLLGVFEEYPGLLNRLRDYDRENGLKPAERLEPKVISLLTRIFLEGRKCLISVVLISQQFSVELTGSSVIRDQLGILLTFRQGATSLRMVHPDITPEEIEIARKFIPGQGFIQKDSGDLETWRAVNTTYPQYAALVQRNQFSM